ncbi:hypothetical protein L195_g028832, partial [Trifolium pratense]
MGVGAYITGDPRGSLGKAAIPYLLTQLYSIQYETMECNGMDGRGLPAPKSDDSLVPLSIGTWGVSTSLARGWDSFTCIPASTTKSSGLHAPTTAVQPFLGFVESGFPFTHNGGPHQTRQAATGHNALFAQQIHFEVDLSARPIVGM